MENDCFVLKTQQNLNKKNYSIFNSLHYFMMFIFSLISSIMKLLTIPFRDSDYERVQDKYYPLNDNFM